MCDLIMRMSFRHAKFLMYRQRGDGGCIVGISIEMAAIYDDS
jgi:hypothetical protein